MAAGLLCDTVFIYLVFSLKSAVMGVTSVGHCDKLWAKAGWVLCVTDIPRSPSEEAEAQLESDLPGQTARRCGSSNEGRGICLPLGHTVSSTPMLALLSFTETRLCPNTYVEQFWEVTYTETDLYPLLQVSF